MFDNAKKGIKKIYKAEILSIIATIVTIVAAVILLAMGSYVKNGEVNSTDVISTLSIIIAVILAVVAYVLNIVGIGNASKDSEDFKNALYMTIAALIVSVVAGILSTKGSSMANALSVSENILEMLAAYYVINGCIGIAKKLANSELEKYGNKSMKLFLTVWILSVVFDVVGKIFGSKAAIAGIVGIVAMVLALVSYVVYLKLLNKTINAL
ncbi:MAG: hypothetical protein IKS77_05530 [Spirochaetales bacterium]|nr:hypothetical protein [Spirochaetales bacterium]